MDSQLRRTTTHVGDLQVGQVWADHDGPVVVLLHGLAEDARSWASIQQRLTGHRTVAVELRGHGDTTLGEADGTLAQLSGDLIAFLEQVTGRGHVVGFSLGGTIVLDAAARRPDLFDRVVVVGTSSVVGRSAVAFYGDRIALVESGDTDAIRVAMMDDTRPAVVTPVDLERLAGTRLEAIGQGHGYVNAARAMAALGAAPLTPRLAQIDAKVHVIGADQDSFCPRRAADIIVGALPRAEYVEISGAGHLIAVDQPDALAEALASALTSSD